MMLPLETRNTRTTAKISQNSPAASEIFGPRGLPEAASTACRRRVAFAALGAIALIALGCSGGTQAPLGSSGQGSHLSGPRVRPKFVVGKPIDGGVYLGAQVNPSSVPNTDATDLEVQTESLETAIYSNQPGPQHFAFHLHYRDWNGMMKIGSDYGILQDIQHGRVPVISWTCGDDLPPYTARQPLDLVGIANGGADPALATIKAQLASLTYPDGTEYPIILRYFWEFNINAANPGPTYDNQGNGNNNCFSGSDSTKFPSQFKNAWNHIHEQLQGNQPVPNLTWDWNPNVQDGGADGQVTTHR